MTARRDDGAAWRRLALFAAIAFVVAATGPTWADDPAAPKPPDAAAPTAVIGPFLLKDTQGRAIGVLYRFPVNDVGKLDENRALAEKLLPAAIRYAEANALPMIGIQAMETVGGVGAVKTMRYYGYVWNKDAAGAWAFYVKAAPQPSP